MGFSKDQINYLRERGEGGGGWNARSDIEENANKVLLYSIKEQK